ncbi:MAG TPA: Gfo/Idh/MocA family oxidoreductase [Caldisericia bacterium]|nr:Gfo/Idh/MocA family oxidoreductase [Caldisericia bacterium]
MKICFVGLGSIGIKHLKNIVSILKSKGIKYSIHALRKENKPINDDVSMEISEVFTSYDQIPSDYDVIFITNPTYLHYEAIYNLADKTKAMFIEKPLFESNKYSIDNIKFKENGIQYVASPLRFHPTIQQAKKYVLQNKIYSFRAICSTYLPNWRKNTDYRKNYSAFKEMGGGVTLDLIHEWDYLIWLFGLPNKVSGYKTKVSHLQISSDDLSVYICSWPHHTGSLHLDYFGRVEKREIEFYTENDVVLFDIKNNQINYLNSGEIVSLPSLDYSSAEISYFINLVLGNYKNNINPPEDAFQTLEISLKSELV